MSAEIAKKVDVSEIIEDLSTADRLLQLDAFLINGEQVDCPLDNQFVPGMYIRERSVPAGTLFTTYTWKVSHPFYCAMGELLIWDTISNGWQYFTAPCRGYTLEGTKRIVYAISDVTWLTFHPFSFITGAETNWSKANRAKLVKRLEGLLLEKYHNKFLDLPKLKEIQCQHS